MAIKDSIKRLFLAAGLVVFASGAYGQGTDGFGEFIIGLGIGGYAFNEYDELRESYKELDREGKNDTSYAAFWAELYLSNAFGLGYRRIIAGTSNTAMDKSSEVTGATTTRDIKIDAAIPTLQLLPFMSEDKKMKFGFLGGQGNANYYIETNNQTPEGESVTESLSSTDGTAQLVGMFFQYKGENWGGRLGYYAFETKFEKLLIGTEEYEVDGSGKATVVDFFYSF
ncbi:MAG: hypothetical protein GY866_10890 [Proteobacteria bacterium]|nr:hypothetical protein [Pseudomonadota bacterium]